MYKVKLLKPNFTCVYLPGGSIYFSYETPIAFSVLEGDTYKYYKSANVWSKTTGRHLNNANLAACETVPNGKFNELLAAAFPSQGDK